MRLRQLPPAQRLDLRIVESHSLGRRDALHAEGAGVVCEVKEEVPAAGRRRGTFARSPRSLRRSTNPLLLFASNPQKTRPRCSGGRARREDAVEGAGDQNTKLMPATGPLNSCFRPTVPSLPFLSTSSLNQS